MPYNQDTLSVLLCYLPREQPRATPTPDSSSDCEGSDIVYHHAVAQLPLEGLVRGVLGVESVDVGAVLVQVYGLGAYKTSSLSVSGSRRVAAVVSEVVMVPYMHVVINLFV